MAEIKGLVDDHGTIYECNKIIPEKYKIQLLEVLAELEDNECHRLHSFPKSQLHKIQGADKVYRAYIDKTDNNRFYKFRVNRSSKFLTLERNYNKSHLQRRYDIVGFQLKYDVGGWINTTDFSTEQTLIYTGYAKGCDETSMGESTLSCSSESLKVLKPMVGHTNYRFGNQNNNGEYDLRDDLNSIFITYVFRNSKKYRI